MKREYKKSRMLFQLVVYHLLLSDLEFDSTGRKIFMLVFGDAEFDEYLRAKGHWNSDLGDFAELLSTTWPRRFRCFQKMKLIFRKFLKSRFRQQRQSRSQKGQILCSKNGTTKAPIVKIKLKMFFGGRKQVLHLRFSQNNLKRVCTTRAIAAPQTISRAGIHQVWSFAPLRAFAE